MLIDKDEAIRAICKVCYAQESGDYKECKYYPCDDVQALESLPSTDVERIKVIMKEANEKDKAEHMGRPTDLISRADAIEAVRMSEHRITIADEQGGVGTVKWDMWGVYTAEAVEAIKALPSAEAVSREEVTEIKNNYINEMSELLNKIDALSAEAEDRLYIKIYADDEPSVKAEKLYQICGETQNREVTKWLKEYFPAEAVQGEWIPCSERLPKRDELVLVTYKTTDRIHLCRYIDDGSENPWWSYIDDCCAWNNVVLAWMPLPKPYKGGDDE